MYVRILSERRRDSVVTDGAQGVCVCVFVFLIMRCVFIF